jgi:hypothetical protein
MPSPAQVIGQIRQLGGKRSADFLNRLFEGIAEREFNPEMGDAIIDRLRRIYGDDYWESAEIRNGTVNGYGGGSGFNLIPSRGHGGACTEFCVVDGIRYGLRPFPSLHYQHALMNLTCAYWFNCHPINNETLILTNYWNDRPASTVSWMRSAIDAYKHSYPGKQVYVVRINHRGVELVYY